MLEKCFVFAAEKIYLVALGELSILISPSYKARNVCTFCHNTSENKTTITAKWKKVDNLNCVAFII